MSYMYKKVIIIDEHGNLEIYKFNNEATSEYNLNIVLNEINKLSRREKNIGKRKKNFVSN